MEVLEKTYFPFVIANTVFFSIAIVPVLGILYSVFYLYIPAIGFSICNFLVAKDGRYGTKPWDLTVLILACLATLPALNGTLSKAGGLAGAASNGLAGGLIGWLGGGVIGSLIGWLSSAVALAFCITILVKYNKWKSRNLRDK